MADTTAPATRTCSMCGHEYECGTWARHTRTREHRLFVARFRIGGHGVTFNS